MHSVVGEEFLKAENINLRGSITVLLVYCLFCLDSAALLIMN